MAERKIDKDTLEVDQPVMRVSRSDLVSELNYINREIDDLSKNKAQIQARLNILNG